ncbi:DUF4956 domain-containing protein [Streptomyces zingiberis]|uniref:DUF4956 domain-containing protein n=1 Tax=Streptomyces zingiberis TaxID=2053010 RepID=A0ABX1C6D4_9ACTN|nr:DUF4956 domain-containing protein [Streptomyces zingiberis]NJQ03472.1 DUF4956 domain-containing protein [Streptomyces zingiberis]
MARTLLFACDIAAVSLLVFALYFPRHRRRDLVVAYLGVNVGVLAVAGSLSVTGSGTGLGLGLALFGVLSIIRLRSTELDQHEVAYYFSALALGVLGAMPTDNLWRSLGLMVLILVALAVGDHPRLLRSYRRQLMVLDTALPDHTALVAHLETTLGARVHAAVVQRLDLVNDTTVVDVRYRVPTGRPAKGEPPAPRSAATSATPLTVRS